MEGSLALACLTNSSGGGKVSSSRSSTSRSSRSSTCSAISASPYRSLYYEFTPFGSSLGLNRVCELTVGRHGVGCAHHMRARHEQRSPRFRAARSRLGVAAAVDLHAHRVGQPVAEARDIPRGSLDVALPAPARIDGH